LGERDPQETKGAATECRPYNRNLARSEASIQPQIASYFADDEPL